MFTDPFRLTMFDIVIGKKAISQRPVNVELLAEYEPIDNGTGSTDARRRAQGRISASDALKSALFAPPAPGRNTAPDQRE